jgi:VanZ family protein
VLPQRELPHPRWFALPYADKYVHFMMYAVLAFLLYRSTWMHKKERPHSILVLLLTTVTYGILIEILQLTLTHDRYFEWGDIAANSTGAILLLIACIRLPQKIFFLRYKI